MEEAVAHKCVSTEDEKLASWTEIVENKSTVMWDQFE